MKTLLLPVCGQSTRFPGVAPKWLLRAPSGNCMLREGISGLRLNGVNRIIIIALRKHVIDNEVYPTEFLRQFDDLRIRTDMLLVEEVKGLTDTICRALPGLTGELLIKDCDNYFKHDCMFGSHIGLASYRLNQCEAGTIAENKGYILSTDRFVKKIVEKKVVSDTFSCGLYYFKDVNFFINCSRAGQCMPDVINRGIEYGYNTMHYPAKNYIDWGTLPDWERWLKCSKQKETISSVM